MSELSNRSRGWGRGRGGGASRGSDRGDRSMQWYNHLAPSLTLFSLQGQK